MQLFKHTLLAACCLTLAAAGCTQPQQADKKQQKPETNFTKAIALIHPTEGNDISGTVTFEKDSAGITVNATVNGLEPMSRHGFHIHRYGDCRAQDGTSAGGHYAPDGNRHGEPGTQTHAGDLGNVVTNEEGTGTLEITASDITLNGPDSIIGRGIIVHANADDMESQPSGAAGPRIGCGVIGIANTAADTTSGM